MSGETLYASGQAAKLAGISAGSLRNYAQGGRFGRFYAPYLSAGAAPAPGQPRQFTGEDIAVLRYVRSRTAQGAAHETIAAELAAGALESFDWQPPAESAAQVRAARQAGQEEEEAQGVDGGRQPAPLAIMAQTLTAELAAARAREQALWNRVVESEAGRARAEGELAALKTAQGRPWYKRLFG
jgi:hypothetical protein